MFRVTTVAPTWRASSAIQTSLYCLGFFGSNFPIDLSFWQTRPIRLRNFKFRFDFILAQFMLKGYQGLINNLSIITDQAPTPFFSVQKVKNR